MRKRGGSGYGRWVTQKNDQIMICIKENVNQLSIREESFNREKPRGLGGWGNYVMGLKEGM